MKSIIFGRRFTPTKPCTWLPETSGRSFGSTCKQHKWARLDETAARFKGFGENEGSINPSILSRRGRSCFFDLCPKGSLRKRTQCLLIPGFLGSNFKCLCVNQYRRLYPISTCPCRPALSSSRVTLYYSTMLYTDNHRRSTAEHNRILQQLALWRP